MKIFLNQPNKKFTVLAVCFAFVCVTYTSHGYIADDQRIINSGVPGPKGLEGQGGGVTVPGPPKFMGD